MLLCEQTRMHISTPLIIGKEKKTCEFFYSHVKGAMRSNKKKTEEVEIERKGWYIRTSQKKKKPPRWSAQETADGAALAHCSTYSQQYYGTKKKAVNDGSPRGQLAALRPSQCQTRPLKANSQKTPTAVKHTHLSPNVRSDVSKS